MFKWFKKHFIPHEGNNHRPCFLHGPNAHKIVLVVIALELILFVLPSVSFFKNSDFMAAVLPSVLNNLTNEKRAGANLNQLKTNSLLEQAALLKTADMASKSYFAHTSPEGFTPWHWLSVSGYRYVIAGENLAVFFTDSRDVTEAWMNSPTHRDNILRQGFTEIGTAVATGTYNGREAIFVAQYYARPVVATSVSTSAPISISQVSVPSTNSVVVSAPAVTSTAVLGEETNTLGEFVEKSMTSPRHTSNIALFIILGIVIFALTINFVTRVNTKHPDLVTNGLAVVAVIFAIYIYNNYLLNTRPVVSQELLSYYSGLTTQAFPT